MTDLFDQLSATATNERMRLDTLPWIRVSTGMMGGSVGAYDTLVAIEAAISERKVEAHVSAVGTTGMCFAEPLIDVTTPGGPRVLYRNVTPDMAIAIVDRHIVKGEPLTELAMASVDCDVAGVVRREDLPMMQGQLRIALRNAGEIEPTNIYHYIARDGFAGLNRALDEMDPGQVLQEVKDSGLRGRGGAAFTTGVKWGFLAGNQSSNKYILCNCEEGDPGAFNDKTILDTDPFSLIEGCIIAGLATGATNGIVFIRHGNESPISRTREAIRVCYEQGILGKSVMGTDFSFEMDISLVGESYVAGEETALMEAIEGKRSMPRFRPPFPAAYGVWGNPSNINNIKTLSYVPEIIRKGSSWFAGIGTEKSAGTAIACLSGDVTYTGLVEVPFGISLRAIVEDLGGGDPHGKTLKFVQTGGPLGGLLPADQLDMILDFDAMAAAGAMFGSGGLIVCNEDRSVVDLVRNLIAFDQMESCGKCFPCRLGTSHLLEVLDRFCAGQAVAKDLGLMARIGANLRSGSLCGHGQLGYNPVDSALKSFSDEFDRQILGSESISADRFISPRATLRGAQIGGGTPTSVVKSDFVNVLQAASLEEEMETKGDR